MYVAVAGEADFHRWPCAGGGQADPKANPGHDGANGQGDQATVADPAADKARQAAHQLQPPRHYAVVMHNDSYTTQQFVVMVLMVVFYHPSERAQQLMLQVDRSGAAVVGTFTFEIAESKIARVTGMARAREYPLRCTMEPQ